MQEVSTNEGSIRSQSSSPYRKNDTKHAAVLSGALYYRAFQQLKNRILWRSRQNYSAVGIIDKESKADLNWWSSHLLENNGRLLITPPVKLVMELDASTQGWGAYCQGMRVGGPWQRREKVQHINSLELKAAFLTLRTFTTMKTNIHVSLRLDNRAAIAYINQKGGTHSRSLSDTACNLWSWCLKRGITVHAEHTAGVENTRTDFESRVFQDPCVWMLSRQVYLKIKEKWGTMDVARPICSKTQPSDKGGITAIVRTQERWQWMLSRRIGVVSTNMLSHHFCLWEELSRRSNANGYRGQY